MIYTKVLRILNGEAEIINNQFFHNEKYTVMMGSKIKLLKNINKVKYNKNSKKLSQN